MQEVEVLEILLARRVELAGASQEAKLESELKYLEALAFGDAKLKSLEYSLQRYKDEVFRLKLSSECDERVSSLMKEMTTTRLDQTWLKLALRLSRRCS